ncbi:MAG: amino acid ABC transporter permease [Thermotogae bacterium]|nr:amino acid ABC transporter permease [Thermotogota bacterium]
MPYWLEVPIKSFPYLLKGAVTTLEVTSLSVLLGLLIGTFVGMGRLSRNPIFSRPATVYVEFIRGTPLLVQIYIIYFGLPSLGLNLPKFPAGIIALGINSGAYVAEIVRAGIQSISHGQYEAARSLGLTHWQAMRYIILPQAFRNILPALGNEFIALTKDSSLVSVIAITELLRAGQIVISRTFQSFSVYFAVALLYFVMTFTMSRMVRWVEKRLAIP